MATSAAPVEEAKGQTGRPPPLTLSNAVKAVEGVHWKELGERLRIPHSKRNEIERKGDNDDERMTKLMEHWMLYDPSPSWRRIIVALDPVASYAHDLKDLKQAREVADRIRSHAEPVADPTLTLPSVTAAVKTVPGRVWHVLAAFLRVPWSKQSEIERQYTTDDQRMTAALDYWIKTVPKASWKQLVESLHLMEGEEAALQETRKHIQKQRDPTLNGDNMYNAVKDVQHWDLFLVEINMPLSQQREVKQQYSGREQQKRAAVDLWLKTHPCPSWDVIVEALYKSEEHHVLRKVQELYVSASEESRRLFQDAMQHGSVDVSAVKVIITGIAGAGKTCSKHVIIGKNPPRIRRSTPCAERPVRVIRVDPRSFDWAEVDSHRVKELLAEVIKSRILGVIQTPRTAVFVSADGSNTSDEASASPQSTQAEDTLSHSVSKPNTESVVSKSDEKPGGSPELQTVGAEEERFTTEDELVKLIQVSQSSGSKPILNISLVHFVDSGGQPQFHEVLPVFLRGTSVCLFVIKLSEELKEHPLVEYYDEDGERIGEPYRAAHTNEQILKHCVTTMQSHKSQAGKGKAPRILILGTHKDKEGECKETRAEKNRKLIQMLLPDFEEEVIYYDEFAKMPELIFPLNSRSPGPEDKETAADIRKWIMQCSPETHQIPISWYALELLLRELAQSHGRQVLSTKRCLAAARNRLHFEDKSFVAALEYLDSLNLIFYYHKSLPNVIFIDPQVLLDKVSELVKFIFQRSGASHLPVAMKDEVMKFRRYGLLTIEFLKQFPQHYVADIFTPDDLIKLFRDLLILADFTSPQFFMPCLLRIIESSEVDQHRASSSATAAPLVLVFHRSPRHGMFCSLVSYLLSPENESPCPWKLVSDRSRSLPKCLFRNCIKFQIPNSPGTITLVDSFKFFEVHVKAPSEICPQLCLVVSDAVFAGLAKASATLSYNNCKPKKAFLCPCGNGDPHPATVADDHHYWVCSEDPEECGCLQSNQLLWLPQTKESSATPVVFDSSNVVEICDVLRECGVSLADWDSLGRRLSNDIDVRAISRSEASLEICLHETVRQWLCKDPEASWRKLAGTVGQISNYGSTVSDLILKKAGVV